MFLPQGEPAPWAGNTCTHTSHTHIRTSHTHTHHTHTHTHHTHTCTSHTHTHTYTHMHTYTYTMIISHITLSMPIISSEIWPIRLMKYLTLSRTGLRKKFSMFTEYHRIATEFFTCSVTKTFFFIIHQGNIRLFCAYKFELTNTDLLLHPFIE